MADPTLRVGDWVLVHRVPYVAPVEAEIWPQWVMIDGLDRSNTVTLSYLATFERTGTLWFGPADIIPDDKITDQQWAELATIRLVKGA